MKYFYIAVALLTSVIPVFALFPPGGGGSRRVPIDGGVALLVGAASVYGAIKMKRKNKQADNNC